MNARLNNEQLLVGLLLVIISVVGLVGGRVMIGQFTLDLSTARGLAYAFLLIVGLCGILIILLESFKS